MAEGCGKQVPTQPSEEHERPGRGTLGYNLVVPKWNSVLCELCSKFDHFTRGNSALTCSSFDLKRKLSPPFAPFIISGCVETFPPVVW